MLHLSLEALLFTIFCLLPAGLLHHLVIIPRNLLSWLKLPLDFHLNLGQKRVFGSSKTWRGVVMMTVFPAILGWIYSQIFLQTTPLSYMPSWQAGFWLGLGYSLGELPTSFIKRRVGVAPSAQASGRLGWLLYILDQVDSILGTAVTALLVFDLTLINPLVLLLGFGLGVFLHMIIDLYLYRAGYKKHVQKPRFLDKSLKQ